MSEDTEDQLRAEYGAALDELEQQLRSALQLLEELRERVEGQAETSRPRPRLEGTAVNFTPPAPERVEQPQHKLREVGRQAEELGTNGSAHAPFERLWDRLEEERREKQQPAEAAATEERHGLDLLPQTYLMTVEDRQQTVDLVPLHRALQGIAGVQEVSLVSFANGVPVVSVRTVGELDLDRLQRSVSTAMDRECEVIPQTNNKIFLRLKPLLERVP